MIKPERESGLISDDDRYSTYNKIDQKKIDKKTESTKRAGEIRTKRTPLATDQYALELTEGFGTISSNSQNDDFGFPNGSKNYYSSPTIHIKSNGTTKNNSITSRPSTATSVQTKIINAPREQSISTVSNGSENHGNDEDINRDEFNHKNKNTDKQKRRKHLKKTSLSVTQNNNNTECDVVSSTNKSENCKPFLENNSDLDDENATVPIRPWTPTQNTLDQSLISTDPNPTELTPALRSLFEMIVEDLDKFVYTPMPNGLGDIQCRITRDRHGVDKNLFPTYYLHAERPGDGKKFFLLAGRKRRRCATSNYIISTDPTDMSRGGEKFVGKLRANMLGTQFTIYDQGENPKRHIPVEQQRREVVAISYETNIFGFKGPRKMTVIIPGMTTDHQRVDVRPGNESEGLIERWKRNDMTNLVELHNKTPVWNEETQSYVLNFHGRVTQASVKNFQIVHDDDQNPYKDYVCMQFGRVSEDVFTCDFKFPLCAVQAFGIALSSFDGKLACE